MSDGNASWEGPAASAAEVVLAEFLDRALDRLAAGEPVNPAELLRQAPELVEQGRQLLHDVNALVAPIAGLSEESRQLQGDLLDLSPAADEGPAPDPFPGEFRVRRRLGSGAFGTVWLAEDVMLGRLVALKTLRAPGGTEAADRLRRLRDEARLLASVRHRNVVAVHAWRETAAGEQFFVLQYVSGGSLADRVPREGPLPWPLAARAVADVAEGLAAVHACGIVHRDVKPANVLWDEEADEALLTDFGVSVRLAGGGGVAGTPHYMPPEAFTGAVSPAQDVYALGATLFWLVTGSVPFPELRPDNAAAVVRRGLPDPDPRCAGLPAPLESVVRSALAADAGWRPSLGELTAALRGSLNRLLADSLVLPAAGTRVRLTVSRRLDRHTYVPVATTGPIAERLVRDVRLVPPEPECVAVRTGERLRVEAEADRDGYLTVFNVGPSGNLNVLFPAAVVRAGRAVPVLEVELTPPAGRERLFALWTREPLTFRTEELRQVAERGEVPPSESYRATRDMVRVQESVQGLTPEDWRAAVLELDHQPGTII